MKHPFTQIKVLQILLYFFILILTNPGAKAQCFTTGSVDGGSFSNDASNGTIGFANPTFAQASDGSRTTASALLSLLTGTTNYLKVTNFNASIPLTATICGIELEVEKSATGINILTSVTDGEIKLVKNGAIVGTNKAVGGKWPTTDTYFTYGGINDLWGTTLAPADVNASNFGVALSSNIIGVLALLPSARIDYVRMTVYYSMILLPVKLISFSVTKKTNNKLHFNWLAENEQDVVKYIIERSDNSTNWEAMYETNHINPELPGKYDIELPTEAFEQKYYRLRIQSKTTGPQFSEIRIIENTPPVSFTLLTGPTIVQIKNVSANSNALIFDMHGRLITEKKVIAGSSNQVDISALAKGVYFLKIGNVAKKFIRL